MNTRSTSTIGAHEVRVLLGRAVVLTRNVDDAWDLVQDTVERALTRMPEDLPLEKKPCWLLAILRNRFIDGLRGKRMYSCPLREEHLEGAFAEEPAEPEPWRRFEPEDVEACLAMLPARLRRTYQMYAVEGLSYRVIAERLSIPLATVGTRLLRARAHLRELLLGGNGGRTRAGQPVAGEAQSQPAAGARPRRLQRTEKTWPLYPPPGPRPPGTYPTDVSPAAVARSASA